MGRVLIGFLYYGGIEMSVCLSTTIGGGGVSRAGGLWLSLLLPSSTHQQCFRLRNQTSRRRITLEFRNDMKCRKNAV